MLYHLIAYLTPALLFCSRRIGCVPRIGRSLRHLVPIADYEGVYPLTESQLREWAILDTLDMLAPAYDSPQSSEIVKEWVRDTCLRDYEVFRSGLLICRGSR